MTRLKERQQQLRESAILETMQSLLARKGYAATSMDDVAAELGISKATLYLHFKSKAELALRVILQQMESTPTDGNALDPGLPAIERLRRRLQTGLRRRVAMGAARPELPPELYADPAYQAVERKMQKAGQALIREAQQAGDIRADLPPALVNEFVFNVFNMNFERLAPEHVDVEAAIDQVVDLAMRAIRP